MSATGIAVADADDLAAAEPTSSLRPASDVELEDPTGTRRATRRRRVPRSVRRLLGPALILAAWQLATSTGAIDDDTLAPPARVGDAFRELWSAGELQEHLLASLSRVGWGLGFGVAIGLVLALLAGFFRLGEDIIDSAMNTLRAIPVIALVPLLILWVGIGEPAKITLIVLGVVFPVYMNTFAGIRSVDQKVVEAAQSFGTGRLGLIGRVILPGSIPGFLVGLRWAIGTAWLLLVFSEQVNASAGIGYLMTQAQSWNRTDIIVLGLVIYGLLGLLADGIVRLLERILLPWRRAFTGT